MDWAPILDASLPIQAHFGDRGDEAEVAWEDVDSLRACRVPGARDLAGVNVVFGGWGTERIVRIAVGLPPTSDEARLLDALAARLGIAPERLRAALRRQEPAWLSARPGG